MRLLVASLVLASAAPALAQYRTHVTTPPGTVFVRPGQDIQAIIDGNAIGTPLYLLAGTYRLTSPLTPTSGQVLIGERQKDARVSTLSGARVLTGWVQDGARWYVTGQTQEGTVGDDPNDCDTGYTRCVYPEELFFNGSTMKFHEDALGDVGAGEWFFDYAADRIYVGDDPTGQLVETSVTPSVFITNSTVDNVVIRSLVIEKFATPNGTGAVNLCAGATGAEHWVAEDNEIRHNHGAGIGFAPFIGCRASRNYIHHNCTYGFTGAGTGIVVDENLVAYNNLLPQYTPSAATAVDRASICGMNEYWGAGGSKFVFTNGLILRRNHSKQNAGPGFWLDIQNIDAIYEYNRVEWNERGGIFHEISCDAVIRYNHLERNGTRDTFPGTADGAGIQVLLSPNVEVYGNVLVENNQGITGEEDVRDGASGESACPDYDLYNFNVHDNIIYSTIHNPGVSGRGRTGVWDGGRDTTTSPHLAGANNTFENNTYFLGPTDDFFTWGTGGAGHIHIGDNAWQVTYGHDNTGSITH